LKCRAPVDRFVNTVLGSRKERVILFAERKNYLLSEQAVVDIGFGPGISLIA
jgi:hypothetical protein